MSKSKMESKYDVAVHKNDWRGIAEIMYEKPELIVFEKRGDNFMIRFDNGKEDIDIDWHFIMALHFDKIQFELRKLKVEGLR